MNIKESNIQALQEQKKARKLLVENKTKTGQNAPKQPLMTKYICFRFGTCNTRPFYGLNQLPPYRGPV